LAADHRSCNRRAFEGPELTLVPQDELTFALWKRNNRRARCWHLCRVLQQSTKRRRGKTEYAKLPTVIHAPKGTLPDRETIIGIVNNGEAKAYPISNLTAQSPVLLDVASNQPVMLVVGPDGKSVRVFSRQVGGRSLDFYGRGSSGDSWALLDTTTLGERGFDGCAVSGDMKGQCLTRIDALKDCWFDWQNYHPHTSIYRH
jgi:Protein of unknown function (DUF3179)